MSVTHKMLMSFTVLFLVAFCLLIVFGDRGIMDMKLSIQERDGIKEKNTKLVEETIALYRSIDRLKHDPAFVESVAKYQLGVIRPDERILKIESGEQKHGGKK